jgi:hypothetical protein
MRRRETDIFRSLQHHYGTTNLKYIALFNNKGSVSSGMRCMRYVYTRVIWQQCHSTNIYFKPDNNTSQPEYT